MRIMPGMRLEKVWRIAAADGVPGSVPGWITAAAAQTPRVPLVAGCPAERSPRADDALPES